MANVVNHSFSEMFFGFNDDHDYGTFEFPDESDVDDHDHRQDQVLEKDNNFWDNQHQLLQGTLRRTSCLETGIRKAVKRVMEELENIPGRVCGCGKPVIAGCRECVMREVSGRLGKEGYNSAICHSKWRSSPDIPSGEHTFVEVVENSKKGIATRVIIEVNLRGEFEVARASEDYDRLLRWLPEVYVGKAERLAAVINIMCGAAKKCMKEKRMHMGPWRKHRYMHAKWLGPCKRTTTAVGPASASAAALLTPPSARPVAVASSMLTVDLLDLMNNNNNNNNSSSNNNNNIMPNNVNMHCKAVISITVV